MLSESKKAAFNIVKEEISSLGWRYLLFLLIIAGSAALTLLPPKVYVFFTEGLSRLANLSEISAKEFLIEFAIFGISVGLLVFISNFVYSVYEEWICLRTEASLRLKALDAIQQTPIANFDQSQRGEWLTRMTGDLGSTERFITKSIPDQLSHLVILIGVTAMFSAHSGIMALILLASAFVLAGINILVQKKMNPLLEQQRDVHGSMFQTMLENLEGIRTIRSLGIEGFIKSKFVDKVKFIEKSGIKVVRTYSLLSGSNSFHTQLISTGCLTIVGFQVHEGSLTVMDALLYPFYIGMFYSSSMGVVNSIFDWQEFFVNACRFAKVINVDRPYIPHSEEPISSSISAIHINNVAVGYPDALPLTRPFEFSLKKGQISMICGHSGCGKSTFLEMLAGLRNLPDNSFVETVSKQGKLKRLQMSHHLSCNLFSYIEQRPYIFEGTLLENLTFDAYKHIEISDIWNSLAKVNLEEFFSQNGGLDFKIADGGKNLSEGQKYRLAIARAFLVNRPFLLMDEPFAGLDLKSIDVVCASLKQIKKSCGVVIVSHILPDNLKVDSTLDFEHLLPAKSETSHQYEDEPTLYGGFSKDPSVQDFYNVH